MSKSAILRDISNVPAGLFGPSKLSTVDAADSALRTPHAVEDYAADILKHLLLRERTPPRDHAYLARQADIEERMRVILIDWVVDVVLKFKLRPETFYLAVDIIDRYLAVAPVSRGMLQLVAITSVLIAAKHEEIWAPEVRECVQITANTYTREEVVRIEREIAAALHYRFTVPTPFPFLVRLLQVAPAGVDDVEHVAHFFLEIAATHYGMLRYLPSRVACAAFALGRWTSLNRLVLARGEAPLALDPNTPTEWLAAVWSPAAAAAVGVEDAKAEVIPAVVDLLRFAVSTAQPTYRFRAVHRKYTSERFLSVARYELPSVVVE